MNRQDLTAELTDGFVIGVVIGLCAVIMYAALALS